MERFTIAVPEARLAAIRGKVASYDWDGLPDAGGWRAGVGKADLRRLAAYWLDRFDWRAVEARLNRLPQFVADIEGTRLHFVHARGDGRRPPLLLLHGWPGSFFEFERLIAPLVAAGHDVVVPSLPGFAFSTPLATVIGPRRIAALMHALMARLSGPARFIVQGGDWGANIACWMAHDRPDALLGIHVNMLGLFAADAEAPAADRALMARRAAIREPELGYNLLQATKPQSLGVATAENPVGAAGWILEKFGGWGDVKRRPDGDPDVWSRFTEEDLLTNIMLYVAPPGAMVTATWIYHGRRLESADRFAPGTRVTVPLGVAAFPDPVFVPPPRALAETTYDVVQWTDMPRGGHFAALEEPALLQAELERFVRKLG